jgi:glycosyltransferase involved in cell wall biosynthesis
VFTPVIVPFYGSPFLRRLNSGLVALQARFLARRLGIDVHRAVAFVTVPTAWDVVRRLGCARILFNRSDLHSAFEETDQDLIRALEHQLLEHADAVLYVSHALEDAERDITGARAVFLDHGVDVEHFSAASASEPSDMATIPHPRVGFFGGIDDYVVDLALLRRVAEDLPQASLVLIGDATCPMDELVALPNVHWLGFKPYEQIPAYGRGFDVALMPWLRNEWIEHANPIKLKEYLALGLPIVSTDFPEVHHYADVVAIGTNPEEFVNLIHSALEEEAVGTAATRRARVADATWDDRARQLLALGEGVR